MEPIETALHPQFVSVMVHAPGEREYRSVATRPSEQAPPHVSAESKLVALLHLLGKPLEFQLGSSSWLDQRLPQEEIEFVRRARIELLVSIASRPTQTDALLALGIKRSEEPYTSEDQELLEAIASSLALLLKQSMRPADRPAGFKECPECGTCYEPATPTCPDDNVLLLPMRIPRCSPAVTGLNADEDRVAWAPCTRPAIARSSGVSRSS